MKTEFKERLTNFYRYPRICLFQDQIADREHFMSYLERAHPRTKQVYIYVHIPYCTSMCNYCPFYHTYYHHSSDGDKARFVDAVVTELQRYASEPYFASGEVVNLNFGGGTPFLLPLQHLERIVGTVFKHFKVCSSPVVSIEGDPIALQDKPKLRAIKALGFTRASFGIQTFNERLRRKLRVDSTVADVYKCVSSLEKSGFDEWGSDMLYNCPEQNTTEIKFNVDRLCELSPSIVDVYDLNISPNTKLAKLVTTGRFASQPSNTKEIEQFAAILETFAEHGFDQVRSVNFAPPGADIKRNGILHQFSEDVLGIGPSARTFLYGGGRNYRNHCSTERYVADLEAGLYPVEAGNIAPQSVLEERDMILFPYYMRARKADLNYERFRPKIADMIESGYVEDRGDEIRLTDLGRRWAGNVQYYFHSEEEKQAMGRSMFLSLRERKNLFNQDTVNV